MPKRPYLREWRKHRGLTQEQVIDRLALLDDPLLPATGASLSRLENGKQPYGQRILEALAEIYETEPGYLLARDPSKEGEVVFLDTLGKLSEAQRRQALAVLEALRSETA